MVKGALDGSFNSNNLYQQYHNTTNQTGEVVSELLSMLHQKYAHLVPQLIQAVQHISPQEQVWYWVDVFLCSWPFLSQCQECLSSGSSVLLARDSLWIIQCVKFTCGASCKIRFQSFLFPASLQSCPYTNQYSFNEDSPSSFSFVKMSSPVHVHSGAEQNSITFTVKTLSDENKQLSSLIYLWIHITVKHISLS